MTMGKATPGPWVWSDFTKPDGDRIETVEDVVATVAHSVKKSGGAFLYGVSLDDEDEDGKSTVICYTGNGPNGSNNARLISASPDLLAALERLLDERDPFQSDTESCECGENGSGFDDDGNICEHIQARRAVAKANGDYRAK